MKPRALFTLLTCSLLLACSFPASEQQCPSASGPSSIPLCTRPGAEPLQLKKGEACVARVRARDWLTHVPLAILRGERYRFSVEPTQLWYDWFQPVHAPRGVAGNWLQKRVNGWKRNPQSDWFAVMATSVDGVSRSERENHAYDIGQNGEVTFQHDGQLALYPNDARGPGFWPELFYANNHGEICVRIERLGPGP